MPKSNEQMMFEGIARWSRSGLSQKAWCEKNSMAYATFHYWYRRYRAKTEEHSACQDTGNGFVKLIMEETNPRTGWCELDLPNGKKLVFNQPVGAEFLQTLIG